MASEDVKTVEPPVQNVAVPEIVGVLGVGLTTTVTGFEVVAQLEELTITK